MGEDMPQTLKQVENYKNDKHTVYTSDVSVNKSNWKVVTIVQNDALNRRITLINLITYTHYLLRPYLFVFPGQIFASTALSSHQNHAFTFRQDHKKNEYDVLYESINKMLDKNRRLARDSEASRKKLMALTLSRVIKEIFLPWH